MRNVIIEIQRVDDVRESVNMTHAIGITMQNVIGNEELTCISAYFPAVFNPATEFANPTINLGTYIEPDDAILLYETLQQMDWAADIGIRMPQDGENVKSIVESWKKMSLFPILNVLPAEKILKDEE